MRFLSFKIAGSGDREADSEPAHELWMQSVNFYESSWWGPWSHFLRYLFLNSRCLVARSIEKIYIYIGVCRTSLLISSEIMSKLVLF